MTPIVLDDTADTYDTFLVAVLRALYGDRYGAVEADKVSHALDQAGLPELIAKASLHESSTDTS